MHRVTKVFSSQGSLSKEGKVNISFVAASAIFLIFAVFVQDGSVIFGWQGAVVVAAALLIVAIGGRSFWRDVANVFLPKGEENKNKHS